MAPSDCMGFFTILTFIFELCGVCWATLRAKKQSKLSEQPNVRNFELAKNCGELA